MYIKGSLDRVETSGMYNAIVADCKRCGQPVHEYQSHVMVVNVDGERTFFHAGCEPAISDKPDLVEDQIGRAR
jgi:hypothetical protein